MEGADALVARARAISEAAHAGQVDKAGAPYLSHPARIAAGFAASDPEARCVAYLHDVVEDCPGWTLAHLAAEGMQPAVIAAVDALTLALRVKIADMRDNMDLSRIADPTAKDRARLEAALARR